MSGSTWTPAPWPGLIPLHPLGFGTILGRSFTALRRNPRVLFGFAVVVQVGVMILTTALMGAVMYAAFSRLFTLRPGSEDFVTVSIGSGALVAVAGVVAGLISVAFTALVQGVVAADVGEAVLGRKASLRALWRRVRAVAWRLIGYAVVLTITVAATVLLISVVTVGGAGALGGFSEISVAIGVIATVLGLIAVVPLMVWLGTKLLLVPSILVLEQTTLRQALVRSWRLTRGRFWVALGVTAVIGATMYVATQVVGLPLSLVLSMASPVLAPTGNAAVGTVLALVLPFVLTQIAVTVIGAISTVVQSTGAALVYLDCRMRHEGLDQDLMACVERIHAGGDDAEDPFVVDPARAVSGTSRPLPRTVWDSLPAAAAPPTPPAAAAPAPPSAPSGLAAGTPPDVVWTPPGSAGSGSA